MTDSLGLIKLLPTVGDSPNFNMDEWFQQLCYGVMVGYVHDDLINEDMVLAALKTPNGINAFSSIPQRLKIEENYIKYFNIQPNLISLIPDDEKTYNICMAAVKLNGDNLQYVPHNIMNDEICTEAIITSENAFKYIPEHLRTENICLAATIEYVTKSLAIPDKFKSVIINKLNNK